MVSWDDLDSTGPIKLYDKNVEKTSVFYKTYGEFQLLSKEGTVTIPKIDAGEPLRTQNQLFIDCLQGNQKPYIADVHKGYDVVRTLMAIQQSIEQEGASVSLVE